MFSLECNCGYKTDDKDRHMAEAKMWKHALKEHKEMLEGMDVKQIAQWLKDKDKKLDAQAKK